MLHTLPSPRTKRIGIVILCALIPVFVLTAYLNATMVYVSNFSKSLPHNGYVLVTFPKVKRAGLYVGFTPPKQFDLGHVFVKEIIGVPGDVITHVDNKVCIHSKCFAPTGQEPFFVDLLKAQIIPDGYYYVAGGSDNSLDSRYASFGLVHERQIIATGFAWQKAPHWKSIEAWAQS